MDIYSASKRQGKHPPLFTHTEVNDCSSIITKPVNSKQQKMNLISGQNSAGR